MDHTTIASLSSSPSSMARRVCSKMSANKTPAVHTRSPRSRYSLTYADWITRALMAAKDKCACLSDIYEWMSFNVPGLQEQRFLHSSKGWKNAVRHTLSINPRFQKLKRLGKPALWTLSEDYLRQAQALTKISMSIGPRRDSGDGVQMLGSNAAVETCSTAVDVVPITSPQSKICYVGKSNVSPDSARQTNLMADLAESKMEQSFNTRIANLAQDSYRSNALLHDAYRNSNFLNAVTSASAATSIPAPTLMQACDAAAAANRAAFFSDLSALASLNALISANNESLDAIDPMRQRFSADTAAFAAAAAAHGLGSVPSSVAATPPLMNFFTPSATNCPFNNSVSRRGSGDSGISTISNSSNSTNASSTMGGAAGMVESLRPFTQSLDVTTLSGLEATLVLPRPLPIQCLTDHKLLLASLIWPNPAAGYFGSN